MPGCLGLDGFWELLGFFLSWAGGKGRGRALGVKVRIKIQKDKSDHIIIKLLIPSTLKKL